MVNIIKRLCHPHFFYIIGGIGSIYIVMGLYKNPSSLYFIIGSLLLLLTAIRFNNVYFIALEIIILCGHGAILFGLGKYIQIVLPILLSLQLIIYYWLTGELKNLIRVMGLLGIAILSIGFSLNYAYIFFAGSLLIFIQSLFLAVNGKEESWIWAILNFYIACANLFIMLV